MKKVFISIIVLLMIIISFIACNSEKNKHNDTISIVYNGHFNDYKDKSSIGKTFDKFFQNPKWTSYGDDRPTIVSFFGIIEADNEKIGVGFQFKVNYDNSFEVVEIRLGENELIPNDEILDFVDLIYNNSN